MIGKFGWGRIALTVSVALNLFLVTLIGVQMWRHRHPDGLLAQASARWLASGQVVQAVLDQAGDQLPAEDARLLRQALTERSAELIRLQRQSRQAMEQLRRDIAQQPYDDAPVRTDLAALAQARQAIRPLVEDMLLELLPRLSPQGRQVLSRLRLLPER